MTPMENDSLPEYVEEIPINHLSREQYSVALNKAARQLRWQAVNVSGDNITFHTQGANNFLGETVTLLMRDDKIIFSSKAMNEYYQRDNQNKLNAELFKKTIAAIIKKNQQSEKSANPLTREKYGAMFPSKTYLVTPVLAYLNVLVFLLMIISGISPVEPDTHSLFLWGGNFRLAVTNGQWWRLITYMFLHAGYMHLLMNMFALFYIGLMLEPLLGKFRFAAAYILTGICAGLASIIMHSYSVGVGASGAIFGMYGVFLAMLTTKHIEKTVRNTMLRTILLFVVFNLGAGIHGNTDNAAHVGGLISGLIIGYAYFPGIARYHEMRKQYVTTSVIAVSVALLCILTISALSRR
jgi:membrane associated rhomboid family serine protease